MTNKPGRAIRCVPRRFFLNGNGRTYGRTDPLIEMRGPILKRQFKNIHRLPQFRPEVSACFNAAVNSHSIKEMSERMEKTIRKTRKRQNRKALRKKRKEKGENNP